MTSDLFSVFDYCLGSSNLIECLIPWNGGLLVALYFFSFLFYFYSLNGVESTLISLENSLTNNMPEMSKVWSGTSHLMVTLFIYLLNICVIGYLPYTFPLASHFMISAGLSFPFWFMSFMINSNLNWRLAWIKSVCEGNSFFASFIVIGSECISILIRPITLAARLSLNVVVGNIMMKMASSLVVSLFFPFSYSIFSFGIPIIMGLMLAFVSFFITLVEFCVMCLQTMIFYSLVISYMAEVMVKPE
uniref:ATP synthase F0 subunit 6 n=1 Tax=Marcia recens TaxID=2490373 RepID=UPI002238531A|nr:ATP synthase F0 subunit 6 [Marcia recens]UYR95115.1 ATP synthase subunit 6 [Marcia recens]